MNRNKLHLEEHAKDWIANGYTNKEIEKELLGLGIAEADVPAMMKEIVRMRNARNTSIGLVYVLIGAVICLVSCVLTIMLPQSNTTLVLYGLTTAGIIVAFIGLMRIFN